MSTQISCPNCGHQFEPNDAMQKQLRAQMVDWQKKKEDEFAAKERILQQQKEEVLKQKEQQERDLVKKLEDERKKQEARLTNELTQKIKQEQSNELTVLQEKAARQEELLKESNKKEIEFLRRMEAVEQKERDLELDTQRRMADERKRVGEQVRREEEEKNKIRENEFQMKIRETEMKLEAQVKLAEEMKRKAEQGSMQMQGEAQELVLEELLRGYFPLDGFSEVGKGDEGADITHNVLNDMRQQCGVIVYESKRTKAWSEKWIEKLKADMRAGKADIAVIVSKVLPKGIDKFGQKDGIWVCSFDNVNIVSTMLRHSLLQVFEANKMLDNVADKKESLYKYMTGNEFRQKWDSIIETYISMQGQLTKEKVRVNKEWNERERQLNIMLKSTTAFIGDIKAIGGLEMQELKLLGDDED